MEVFHAVSVFWSEMVEKRDAKMDEEHALIQFKQLSHSMGSELDHDEEFYKEMFPDYLGTFDSQNELSEVGCKDKFP